MKALLLALLLAACGDNRHAAPDASAPDASAGAFRCGNDTCDPATQYCYQIAAGVTSPGCQPLPTSCTTCDCVTAAFPPSDCAGVLNCAAVGDEITLVCALP